MALENDTPRSRRALLVAALGAGAATVASALGRPLPARAGNGDTVTVGSWMTATLETKIDTLDSGATAIHGNSGSNGIAIYGTSYSGAGVLGDCPSGYGVRGISYNAGTFGVSGENTNGTGVSGTSGAGTGVYASSGSGIALQVAGKARFSRSGKASVLAGQMYVDVTVAGGLASNSVVHATLQTYHSGVAIAAARKHYPTTGKVRIYLTKVASTASSTSVGWFVAEY
jgi:hypothetical protein